MLSPMLLLTKSLIEEDYVTAKWHSKLFVELSKEILFDLSPYNKRSGDLS